MIATIFGGLYGFQNKNKRSFTDIGTFYCCYLPVAILKIYGNTSYIPEYKMNPYQGFKTTLIATPIVLAANMGVGVLVGDMGRKAICDEDA